MTGMKTIKHISNEGYALSCNGNVHVLLTFKNFLLVLLFQMPYSTINIQYVSQDTVYVTGFGKTDHNVTFCISRNTVLKH